MKINTKKMCVRVLLGIFVILAVTINSYSYIIANRLEDTFNNPGESRSIIGSYIIDGAGYFLMGQADFLLFLNRVERADEPDVLDYTELQIIVDRAIVNMEKAKEAYESLEQAAAVAPYNPTVIEKLSNFDYKGFQKSHRVIGNSCYNG